jgi:helix-turn-helix protein
LFDATHFFFVCDKKKNGRVIMTQEEEHAKMKFDLFWRLAKDRSKRFSFNHLGKVGNRGVNLKALANSNRRPVCCKTRFKFVKEEKQFCYCYR